MSNKGKIKFFKIILLIVAIILIIGMIWNMVPIIKGLFSESGKLEYKEKVEEAGVFGVFMIVGLELIKVFLAFIPGEPIEIVTGMCYGKIWGTLIIMCSAAVATTIIYCLVRVFGRKFIYNFLSEEKVEKFENMKLFKNENRLEIVLLILFISPFVPKDVLIYLAGILPINPLKFLLISILGRFPSVFSSTFAGETLVKGNFKGTIFIYLISYSITFRNFIALETFYNFKSKDS